MRVSPKALVLPLVLLAAACGAPSGPAPNHSDKTAPQAVTRGGTFAFGARGGAQHLNWYQEGGGAAGVTFGPIFEGLVSFEYAPGKDYRQDLRVIPAIAESWQRTDDTTYVFKIRQNAYWHDGDQVTANDVVFTYNYVRDPKNTVALGSSLASIDKLEAPDPFTLRMTTKGVAPNLLRDLSERSLVILPKHVADKGTRFEDSGVGSGPFKLEKYDRAGGATYVRNDKYWLPDSPYIDRLKINWPLDNSALLAAFATGQNDVLQIQDQPQLDAAKAIKPDLQYGEYVGDNEDAFYMRVDRKPFNDIRVRRAIHLGTDRQNVLNILMGGKGVLNPPAMNGARTGWVIPQDELVKLPGYRAPKEQDIAEAKRLLAEAGYLQGLKFNMKFNQTHTRAPKLSEVLSAQLKQVGVDAVLSPVERASFFRDQKDGNFDAYVDTIGRFEPVANWRAQFHSGPSGSQNGGMINDTDLDALLDQFDKNLNEEEQKRLYIQIQRLLLDKVYAVSTVAPINFAAWQPWVRDYVFNAAGQSYPLNYQTLKLDLNRVPKDR